mgnify:FL=1
MIIPFLRKIDMAAIVSVLVIVLVLVSAYILGYVGQETSTQGWLGKIRNNLTMMFCVSVICIIFFAVYFIIYDLINQIL